MKHERKDLWTADNDKLLANIIINHIRKGSSQLAAFNEASQQLIRTSAACGFRWNSEVRKYYENEIKLAKEQRKEGKTNRADINETEKPLTEYMITVSTTNEKNKYANDHLDQIIQLVNHQKILLANTVKQIKEFQEQLSEKEREVEFLRRELEKVTTFPNAVTVNEDYKTLLQILQRARRLGAIEDKDKVKPAFKMDSQGNIEIIK